MHRGGWKFVPMPGKRIKLATSLLVSLTMYDLQCMIHDALALVAATPRPCCYQRDHGYVVYIVPLLATLCCNCDGCQKQPKSEAGAPSTLASEWSKYHTEIAGASVGGFDFLLPSFLLRDLVIEGP